VIVRIICTAGGSGAGKSTLADGLFARFGADAVSVLRLDDYQHEDDRVPRAVCSDRPHRNYDHPSAIDFGRFEADLAALKAGSDIVVTRRMKRRPMEKSAEAGERFVVRAKPLVIVEGYLALHSAEARAQYDLSVFLRATAETRVARRRWAKGTVYVREVLLPMHDYFIEPTAAFADLVIDVDDISEADVLERVAARIESMAK
jgi:uridine kinase